MQIELTRFKVKEGKSSKVNEWMKLLRDRLPEVLATLDGEKMYVEAIFREQTTAGEYLYWFSIRGKDGINIKESKHEIDKLHLKYFNECIDAKDPNARTNIPIELFLQSKNTRIA